MVCLQTGEAGCHAALRVVMFPCECTELCLCQCLSLLWCGIALDQAQSDLCGPAGEDIQRRGVVAQQHTA